MPAELVTIEVGSRLIGLDEPVLKRRALRGSYGPTTQRPDGEVLISTRGLELAARCSFSIAQIEAAKAGKPLPPDFVPPFHPTRKKRGLEEIARIVLMTPHDGGRS